MTFRKPAPWHLIGKTEGILSQESTGEAAAIWSPARAHTHTHIHTRHTRALAHTYTRMRAHIHAHTNARAHTYTHAHPRRGEPRSSRRPATTHEHLKIIPFLQRSVKTKTRICAKMGPRLLPRGSSSKNPRSAGVRKTRPTFPPGGGPPREPQPCPHGTPRDLRPRRPARGPR